MKTHAEYRQHDDLACHAYGTNFVNNKQLDNRDAKTKQQAKGRDAENYALPFFEGSEQNRCVAEEAV